MESNFRFLSSEYPILANLGILAERYIHDDPNTALFKMRLFGEKMVETIFEIHQLDFPYENTPFRRLEMLKDEGILEDNILGLFHTIRESGSSCREVGRRIGKGYYWVYYDPVNRLVLFDYRKTRGREGPDEMLKNFSGHLQTDGYTAYNNLKNQANITQLACMAHARRKFEHAKDNDPHRASWAMTMIQKLYDIERQAREESLLPDAIKELRQQQAKPILDEMGLWLKEQVNITLPKSAIGGAIAYTLTLWPRLIRYIEDGRFQIDNNLIENSIRPVALGRKNYLFAGSHEAAQNAAVIYSLLATCKINNVEPQAWLTQTLAVISDYPANQLQKLLPGQK